MVLFGIAAVMLAFAVIVFSVASLCKAIGAHLPEHRQELTDDEKEVLKAQAEASRAYADGINNIMSYGMFGKGESR